jgi:hypothetical protein
LAGIGVGLLFWPRTANRDEVGQGEWVELPELGRDLRLWRFREGDPWSVMMRRPGTDSWTVIGQADEEPDGQIVLRDRVRLEAELDRAVPDTLVRLSRPAADVNDRRGVCHPRGFWIDERAAMSKAARERQNRLTSEPGMAYRVFYVDLPGAPARQFVEFDDCNQETRTLIDIKSHDEEFLARARGSLPFSRSFNDDVLEQARRQIDAAGPDWRIEWRVPSQQAADEFTRILDSEERTRNRISVVVVP